MKDAILVLLWLALVALTIYLDNLSNPFFGF